MDPRTRLLGLAAIGGLAVLLDRPLALGSLALFSAMILLSRPIGWRWRRRAAGLLLAVVWSTVLSQGLFYGGLPRVPLLQLGPLTIWREGLFYGLVQSLRFVAVSCAGLAVAQSTPPDRLFSGLVALRVPYTLAFLAVTALRFVPVVGSELLVVRRARRQRGRPAWQRSPWAWLVLEVSLLRPVVARALRRAHAMAEALDTRGFDPDTPPPPAPPLPWGDRLLLGGSTALVGAVFVLRGLTWLYVAEVVYVPALRPVYGLVRSWLG